MPRFLDPTGKATYGIALCARCSRKMFLEDLFPDPNSPGLMVCREDLDQLDPYRLPARQTERIDLLFNRPDVPLTGASPDLPVFNVLAQRLVTEDGKAIMTEDGQYIDVDIAPNPAVDLP